MFAKVPKQFQGLARRAVVCASLALLITVYAASRVRGDEPASVLLAFRYTPVARAQVAIWIEDAAGHFLATVALTEAVAYRGIGNRPGASEMNSGYRWPYGRREGVLPIWAQRRAAATGAKQFPRVIFQNRSEGAGTRAVSDYSVDDYYCLQFDTKLSSRDKLDAVSCASLFHSDKGRYLTPDDVAKQYAEPWQDIGRDAGSMQPLPLGSLYPPRMDVTRCTTDDCFDHVDLTHFAQDARDVMPDIDAVTRATAPGEVPQELLFSVPAGWAPGAYVAFIEVNVEGDYNAQWNNTTYPTPRLPDTGWDQYAIVYGYAYRGQPSVVYELPFTLGGAGEPSLAVAEAAGRSSWDVWNSGYGQLESISLVSKDPSSLADSDGSGVDRLHADSRGMRFAVQVKKGTAAPLNAAGAAADGGVPPQAEAVLDAGGVASDPTSTQPTAAFAPVGAVTDLSSRRHDNPLRAHTWAILRLSAARSERPIHDYEVRVATEPINDVPSFIRDGRPAKNATDAAEGATALMLPTDVPEGAPIEAAIGDLVAQTHYYVGVRATDDLNRHGPISVAEITTTARKFATVSPCFVATAAYGSALASQVAVLRHVRDRYLLSTAPGRAIVAAYYAAGPLAARAIERHAAWRSLVRACLAPVVALAKRLP